MVIRELEQHVTHSKHKMNIRYYLHYYCYFIACRTIQYGHPRDHLCSWIYELLGGKGNREKIQSSEDNVCSHSNGCRHIKLNSEEFGAEKCFWKF